VNCDKFRLLTRGFSWGTHKIKEMNHKKNLSLLGSRNGRRFSGQGQFISEGHRVRSPYNPAADNARFAIHLDENEWIVTEPDLFHVYQEDQLPEIINRMEDGGEPVQPKKFYPIPETEPGLDKCPLLIHYYLQSMNEEINPRRRFEKSSLFQQKGGDQPFNSLQSIFKNFHLDDFREEINSWRDMALCNDQSAYDSGDAREDLMDFTKELQKLIEAFHLINIRAIQRKKNRPAGYLSGQAKKLLSSLNIPVLLTEEESAAPLTVLLRFSKYFSREYAFTELWDLLDAVISYRGHNQVNKPNLIFFYQHLYFLVGLAYQELDNADQGVDGLTKNKG